MNDAAREGNLYKMKWLLVNGYPYNSGVFNNAA